MLSPSVLRTCSFASRKGIGCIAEPLRPGFPSKTMMRSARKSCATMSCSTTKAKACLKSMRCLSALATVSLSSMSRKALGSSSK